MYLDRLEVNFENKPCYDIVISDDFSGLKKEPSALSPNFLLARLCFFSFFSFLSGAVFPLFGFTNFP